MVDMDQINGPDLIGAAFKKRGMTADDLAESINDRRSLIRKTFKTRKRVDKDDASLLGQWRRDDELIIDILGFRSPEKHVFPDKDGNPQDIGLTSLEAATRLNHLITLAAERKQNGEKRGTEDQ